MRLGRAVVVFRRTEDGVNWLYISRPESGCEDAFPDGIEFHFVDVIHPRITAFSELFYPIKFLDKPKFTVSLPITWFILEIALPFFFFFLLDSLRFGNGKFRVANIFKNFVEIIFRNRSITWVF